MKYVTDINNDLGWTVKEQQCHTYIRRAYKALKETNKLDRQFYMNESLIRLSDLYETAIENEHFKFASEIEDKKQNLLSLKEYNNKEFVTNVKMDGIIDFRFEEIDLNKFKDAPDTEETDKK